MPQNVTDIQSVPQNGNGKQVQAVSSHMAHGKGLNKFEEFQGPGFRFVQSFLLLIMALVGGIVVITAFLFWHFSMDVTVDGKGVIEPVHRHRVKMPITGIIQQIHVCAGDKVEQEDMLATLDDTDWRVEIAKTVCYHHASAFFKFFLEDRNHPVPVFTVELLRNLEYGVMCEREPPFFYLLD